MPTESKAEAELKAQVLAHGALPRHIAVIMDGNGRWARARNLPRFAGHREGVKSVRDITRACGELGIENLTLYTFSAENWRRPRPEVNALMGLLVKTIKAEIQELMDNDVRLTAIGCLTDLPTKARKELQGAIEITAHSKGLNLTLALSYGGRQEIVDAVKGIAGEVHAGRLQPDAVDEHVVAAHLYTSGMPDPELLIRTSGEARLSNFLLWQSAYTELVITETMWPEFRRGQLYQILLEYQQRERRFGRLSEQLKRPTAVG